MRKNHRTYTLNHCKIEKIREISYSNIISNLLFISKVNFTFRYVLRLPTNNPQNSPSDIKEDGT